MTYLIFCRNLKMPFCHFWVDVTLIIFKTKRHFRIAFCKESSAYSVIFDDMDTIVHIFKKTMPFYYNFVFQVRSASVHRCLCAQHAWNSTRTPTTFSHSQKVHSGRFFHMESIKEQSTLFPCAQEFRRLFKIFLMPKGQQISKQNCHAETSPKKRTNEFVFLS